MDKNCRYELQRSIFSEKKLYTPTSDPGRNKVLSLCKIEVELDTLLLPYFN